MIATNFKPFSLGQVVATPGAIAVLEENAVSPANLLRRHSRCDWGAVCEEDWALNDEALNAGDRLLSSYRVGDGKIWIITEADRSATTLLTPSEY